VKPQPTAPVQRIAVTREEAAASVGVSLSHFERHIQPELRLIYSGKARLVPIRELEAWADRSATRAGYPQIRKESAPAPRQRPGAWPKET
jgi:hypothetical protein